MGLLPFLDNRNAGIVDNIDQLEPVLEVFACKQVVEVDGHNVFCRLRAYNRHVFARYRMPP